MAILLDPYNKDDCKVLVELVKTIRSELHYNGGVSMEFRDSMVSLCEKVDKVLELFEDQGYELHTEH